MGEFQTKAVGEFSYGTGVNVETRNLNLTEADGSHNRGTAKFMDSNRVNLDVNMTGGNIG